MKVSKYNILVKSFDKRYKSKPLLFNALTCSLVEIEKSYIQYFHLLEGNRILDISIFRNKKEMFSQLEKGGFILPDEFDEINFLKYLSNLARYSSKSTIFTILPTLQCNFQCSYCYEEHTNQTMNNEVEEKIIEIATKRLERGSPSLFCEWYGGEPLLAIDIIERLSKKFMAIAKKYNIPYSAGMISNGYLLKRETVNLLKELKVEKLQITIDGPPAFHNKRRKLKSGDGTFDTIIENICYAANYIPVILRINIDKRNAFAIDDLLKMLTEYRLNEKNISPYLGFVRATTSACKSSFAYCLSEEEFALNNTNFIEKLYNYGFKNYNYPTPSYQLCGAVTEGAYTIAPDGNLFKCWETVGIQDEAIGNLLGNNIESYHQINSLNWMSYDPFEKKQCRKCKIFPLCFGGCPSASVKHISGKIFRDATCSTYKHNTYFNKMMEIVYSKYLRGDFKKEEEAKKEESSKEISQEELKNKATTNINQAQEEIKSKDSQIKD
ncbi:MAG: SPASM domain-containing protein [Bacteroidales bacterium]|nr:SPASM domain-containing protein [Bacteroidales bacterium]